MYNSTNIRETTDNSVTHFQHLQDGGALASGSEPTNNGQDSHVKRSGPANVLDRLSRTGVRAFPTSAPTSGSARRSRLQRQTEVCETISNSPERGSLTPAMRKIYLKDLLLNNSSGGFASVLSSKGSSASSREVCEEEEGGGWALCPMEHAWMLSVIDGNCETIMDFLSEDSSLLTRKDFVSGFTVLHWLAKSGQDETLIHLLRHAEKEGIPVVNLKGSGGLTPLHVAAMHSQYMVIKILVGAFGANIDAMDYNGRKAWQYLKGNAPEEMKELLGTWDDEHRSVGQQNTNNSATLVPKLELSERDDPVYFDRTRSNGSWRGSFRTFLAPFVFFVNKS